MKSSLSPTVILKREWVPSPRDEFVFGFGDSRIGRGPVELVSQFAQPSHNDHLGKAPKRILFILLANQGRSVSRADLIQALWGEDEDGGPENVNKIIDLYMFKLRRVEHQLDIRIITEWGRGYKVIVLPVGTGKQSQGPEALVPAVP